VPTRWLPISVLPSADCCAQQRFTNDLASYRAMKTFARGHRDRVWAGGDGLRFMAVEVGLGHVVAHGGARVGVAHRVLHVGNADTGDCATGRCAIID